MKSHEEGSKRAGPWTRFFSGLELRKTQRYMIAEVWKGIKKALSRFRYVRQATRPKLDCFLSRIGLSPRPCRSFLPPVLPRLPRVAPAGHLWNALPITTYLGEGGKYHSRITRGISLDVPAPGLPAWFSHFDWVVGEYFGFARQKRRANSVFVFGQNLANFVRWLDVELTRKSVSLGKDAFIVVGGKDTLPRNYDQRLVSHLKDHFSKVFFEANDGDDSDLGIYPLALSDSYIRGHEDLIRSLIINPLEKTTLLLAAWGRKWPELDSTIDDRAQALEFVKQAPFISMASAPMEEHLVHLAEANYMMYPRGQAIQSPKGFEALMLRSIPIVTSHPVFNHLRTLGMPLLIVDSWHEITEELLWQELPRLKQEMDSFWPYTQNPASWWNLCFGRAPNNFSGKPHTLVGL